MPILQCLWLCNKHVSCCSFPVLIVFCHTYIIVAKLIFRMLLAVCLDREKQFFKQLIGFILFVDFYFLSLQNPFLYLHSKYFTELKNFVKSIDFTIILSLNLYAVVPLYSCNQTRIVGNSQISDVSDLSSPRRSTSEKF